jgi:hypothetical protein
MRRDNNRIGAIFMMRLKIPSEKDIREAYRKGEDAVVEVFHEVLSCIKDLSRHIEKQQQVIDGCKGKLLKTVATAANHLPAMDSKIDEQAV